MEEEEEEGEGGGGATAAGAEHTSEVRRKLSPGVPAGDEMVHDDPRQHGRHLCVGRFLGCRRRWSILPIRCRRRGWGRAMTARGRRGMPVGSTRWLEPEKTRRLANMVLAIMSCSPSTGSTRAYTTAATTAADLRRGVRSGGSPCLIGGSVAGSSDNSLS